VTAAIVVMVLLLLSILLLPALSALLFLSGLIVVIRKEPVRGHALLAGIFGLAASGLLHLIPFK